MVVTYLVFDVRLCGRYICLVGVSGSVAVGEVNLLPVFNRGTGYRSMLWVVLRQTRKCGRSWVLSGLTQPFVPRLPPGCVGWPCSAPHSHSETQADRQAIVSTSPRVTMVFVLGEPEDKWGL